MRNSQRENETALCQIVKQSKSVLRYSRLSVCVIDCSFIRSSVSSDTHESIQHMEH